MSEHRAAVGTLLGLDARRLAGAVRHPSAGAWVGLGLPALLVGGVLWVVRSTAEPRVAGGEAGLLVGLLVAAPISFAGYTVLFRAADDRLLRRLGVAPGALFVERALRLLALALVLAVLGSVPFASAGRLLAAAVAAALAAWGGAVASVSLAARSLALRRPGEGSGWLGMGMWDRELAGAAPLVYAPLPPLLAGALAGAVTAATDQAAWSRVLVCLALALVAAALALPWYAAALPRFAPQALEMAFAPPPGDTGELHVGRGMARLLPRRAAAVWARDAVVAARRLAWASRLAWPVGIVSVFALARWGEQPETRSWVGGVLLLSLLAQSAASVELGRMERRGPRWLDRSLGVGVSTRLLGRWAWGFGLALWLTTPVALAWSWWTPAGAGWTWILAGGATAGLAAVASLASAGWR